MSDEPDIEPETVKKIFTEKLHRMPPQHLTENGFRYVYIAELHPPLASTMRTVFVCLQVL